MEFNTKPREIEPRFARDGDQMAVFATHYDDAPPVTAVRTTNLAEVGEPLVTWVTLLASPVLAHPKQRQGPCGTFMLTFAVPGDPAKIVTMPFREREQIVIRERVVVEPWDAPGESAGVLMVCCNRRYADVANTIGHVCPAPGQPAVGWDMPAECLRNVAGGTCYLPRGHEGDCDPEPTEQTGAVKLPPTTSADAA